ncbi:TetR family transcriptional regulator [Ensifer adhaerens]|uniref:TetR family transcriptional regulator n=1 Tax=Ensifer adhaerens TaxID=106592 RepID=UPI001CBBD564|nr:TetR family transcriptional regulator [Ensifer adhaerens]MBZ7924413.1 TetR family transcriptional regulator [Ensifer adhaerens]UAX96342.1 TetR family transcriptional regulator [Ensifer adhaerens]UAY04315.1 TetR family transcriptional regulator [Ensifer adhaerens]UAY12300.1 TetR family transcriptional regulator [Ensifer adhaerens]
MPRPKTMPDEEVLSAAFALMRSHGPDGLTFAALAASTGLSGATLVQRFENKTQLIQRALIQAWDGLDRQTAELMAAVPRTPEGAVALLVGLSGDYGGIDSYADDLRILREDLRDPVLRVRGARWRDVLSAVLDECLADLPAAAPGLGLLMASQWQGSLLWWSFDPRVPVTDFVEQSLARFVEAFARRPAD